MKQVKVQLLAILLLACSQVGAQHLFRDSVINPRYHTYEEILVYLDSIQQIPAYSAILDVREIGRSNNEDLPIYAIKLSDNPTLDEDEPALLFLGQCHAEEILGLEITMGLVDSLLHGFDAMNSHIGAILQNTEVWVVPTYNPEGLRVVHDGLDVTYRKNKTDSNGNGSFDFVEGIGFDIDGVDFNRNYGFNWIFGDALGVGDYDYYRGSAPFSESETRAVAALARQEKFMFSVAYHSARSGTPEIIYYPWLWEDVKTPPGADILSSLANTLSQRIINESRDGNYAVTPGKTPRGDAHDWFYVETGAIQFLIEVGTNNLQPNANIVNDTVDRNLEGLFFLMDRAYGRSTESKSMIRGIISDASDGFALEGARIQLAKLAVGGSLENLEGLMLQPRVTDGFGRYRRLVNHGTYRVIASAPGYRADTLATILTSDSYATILDFSLEPMDEHLIELNLTQTADAYDVLVWDDFQKDTLSLAAGVNSFSWQGDEINLKVSATGYFPEIHSYDLSDYSPGATLVLTVTLPATPTTVYSTSFDDLNDWTLNSGSWVLSEGRLLSQPELFYGEAVDMELELANIDFSLVPDAKRLGLYLKHRYEVEWNFDTLSLEVWSNDESELLLRQDWVDQHYEDHVETYFIHADLPPSGRLKLRMLADSTVAFRGWAIDSLALFVSESELLGIDPSVKERQLQSGQENFIQAVSLAPNPFQTQARLEFDVPRAEHLSISVFDIRGRQIYAEDLEASPGINSWLWSGQDIQGHSVSAGIYFVRVASSSRAVTRKLMFMNYSHH